MTRLIHAKIKNSEKSVLLLGPRQVGKSTLLTSLGCDLTINLADPSEYLAFSTNPAELQQRVAVLNPKTIFIDEIQRVPDLLNAVQVLIDNSKGAIKFYLSGSSARKLRRGSANLLPGRLFNYRLGPLSALELNLKLNTEKALKFGSLPEPYFHKSEEFCEKLLRSYTATYLHEEILAESLVRQIQGFSRFLRVACENSGKFLDFSKIATKAKVNRSAARRYYEILEDTLICDRLEAYSSDDEFDLVRHPKFYFFDIGVVNGVLNNFVASADRRGFLFEHLFFNQLKNMLFGKDLEAKISHFRTRGGLEVDFIIEIKGRRIAVEVKSSEPASYEIEPLKRISEYLGPSTEKFVACHIGKAKKVDGIAILPWQKVLQEIISP